MKLSKFKTQNQWREAGPFGLILTFAGVHGIRGRAQATMTDQDGDIQDVLLPDFAEMVPHMVGGKISGEFTIQKRGTKYGIKLWGLRGQNKADS